MDVTDKIRPWMKECRLCPRNCGADRMAGQIQRSWLQGLLSICGRSPAFPGKRDQELYFFPDVRWDAISVRTEEYPGARGERRLHRNTW